MSITIPSWTIPTVLSIACLLMMFRPYHTCGDYDFGQIFRLFWFIPIGFIWMIHFGILLLIRK